MILGPPYGERTVAAATRSNEWVCGLSLAGIVGSNLAGHKSLSLLSAMCYQVEVSCVGLIPRLEVSY
jgi:hypothetical protein